MASRLYDVLGKAEYYHEFVGMYGKYNQELHEIDDRVEECDLYDLYIVFHQRDTKIFFYEVDGQTVGFIIVGVNTNKHIKSDYYIQETYIKPQYRHKGYGRSMCNQIINMYPSMVNMYILKKNDYAIKFWSAVYEKYEDVSAEYGEDDELCYEKFYRKKGGC